MTEKLITINHFIYGPDPATEAELARIKLEANGIQCFLLGKHFISTYWLSSGADRGIKLMVKQSDADRAKEILKADKNLDAQKVKEMPAETIDQTCPSYGSEDIEYETFSRKCFFLGILLFRFPLPFLKKKHRCKNCGKIWK